MSLNLFLNYERTNSKGLFYREVDSVNPSFAVSAKVKFANTALSALPIPTRYSAKYKVNSGNEEDFNLITGQLLSFNRSTACVSSVDVTIKDGDGTELQTLSLSAKFVEKFPTVSFIAYPQQYIDENGVSPSLSGIKTLNDTNW